MLQQNRHCGFEPLVLSAKVSRVNTLPGSHIYLKCAYRADFSAVFYLLRPLFRVKIISYGITKQVKDHNRYKYGYTG